MQKKEIKTLSLEKKRKKKNQTWVEPGVKTVNSWYYKLDSEKREKGQDQGD